MILLKENSKYIKYIVYLYVALGFLIFLNGDLIITDTDSLYNHYPNLISGAESSCKQTFIFSIFGGVGVENIYHWHTKYFPYNIFCIIPRNLILDAINIWVLLFTFLSHLFLYLTSIRINNNKLLSLFISTAFIFSGSYWFLTTSFVAIYQFFNFCLALFTITLLFRYKLKKIQSAFCFSILFFNTYSISNSGVITYSTAFLASILFYIFLNLFINKNFKKTLINATIISLLCFLGFVNSPRFNDDVIRVQDLSKYSLKEKLSSFNFSKSYEKFVASQFTAMSLVNPFSFGKDIHTSQTVANNVIGTGGKNTQFHTIPYLGIIPLLMLCRPIKINKTKKIFFSIFPLIYAGLFLNIFKILDLLEIFLPYRIHAIIPKMLFITSVLFIVLFSSDFLITQNISRNSTNSLRKFIMPSHRYFLVILANNFAGLITVAFLFFYRLEDNSFLIPFFVTLNFIFCGIIFYLIFLETRRKIFKISIKSLFSLLYVSIFISLIIFSILILNKGYLFLNISTNILFANIAITLINIYFFRKFVNLKLLLAER